MTLTDVLLLAIALFIVVRTALARAEHRELLTMLNDLAEMLGEEIDRRKAKE